MQSLHCFSMVTFTPALSGNWLFSPSADQLSWVLSAGSLLTLFVAIVLLVAHFGIPSFVKASMTKLSSKMYAVGYLTRIWARKRNRGTGKYATIWFCLIFAAGLAVGHLWPRPEHVTLYGLRVQRVLSDDSLNVISAETGPVRLDICPENHMEQYLPKAGYVLCRIIYTPRGCMDVDPRKGNKFEWVIDKDGWTTTLTEQDTFKPWPDCHRDEPVARNQ